MLKPGVYEQIINKEINNQLNEVPSFLQSTAPIDKAEASHTLAQYLTSVIQQGLENIKTKSDDINSQVALANEIIGLIKEKTKQPDFESLQIDKRAEQLFALLKENDPLLVLGKTAEDILRPETSIAQSSLFTGAEYEPQMFSELKKEIISCNKIDMLVSFIKWSGLRLIIDELQEFTQTGGELRIITTSYMGATDPKAVEELCKLKSTKVKISYDTKRTRLHAKAYIFYRGTNFHTAYIGSSNLSNPAITSGLEWNVKIASKDLPYTFDKISATFETYWNAPQFEPYQENDKKRLVSAIRAEHAHKIDSNRQIVFDIHPYTYQQEILDKLQADREIRGQYRNLVVAATGTGKTVISAFDYLNFCKVNKGEKNRLLFIAHREEILKQSLDTFQGILKNPNFGDLYVGNYKPNDIDYLFISVQTLNSQCLYDKLPVNYYDYIVIDEFHHAAAPTYQKLLEYFKPKILLGLTATPERMDGQSILEYFNGRIAAEIRLPEAIEQKLLSPFQYFGVSDTVDLTDIHWARGGYDKSELTNVFVSNKNIAERRAEHIKNSLEKYVTDIGMVKGLGFCVSIEHAKFMADYFNKCEIPSIMLNGQSSHEERHLAKSRLLSGELRFIFVVDIYNEGVDIPEVNTVLFLRPTESLTIFLQQLGRGLRLADQKDCLTVLDFIGNANKKYNFEEKFAALLYNTNHSVQYELKNDFLSVPKGCYIQLEKKAKEAILNNIRSTYDNRSELIRRISTFTEDTGLLLNLSNFLEYYHLNATDIYSKDSFSRLCCEAKVINNFSEPAESVLTKALLRFYSTNSRRFIEFLKENLPELSKININKMHELEKRMLQMFYVTVWLDAVDNWSDAKVCANIKSLIDSPILLDELLQLLNYNYNHIDFIDKPAHLGFDCPLDVYCTYTRDQILVAMDFLKTSTVREGVKWLPDKNIDIFFITLNKSDRDYSPTTMYNDYSINDKLFHWQSQSTTSELSDTGKRYIKHKEIGCKVLLFVREYKKGAAIAAPYTFLGPAEYVSHEGSKPMSIIWRLANPIPAKYLKKTNKLVAL